MSRLFLLIAAVTLQVSASTIVFRPVPGTAPAVPITITITDEAGGVRISATVDAGGATTGDIRGLFFDLAAIPAGLTCANGGALLADCQLGIDSVVDLGGGANMQGLGHLFDLGVEIGTPGIGGDDVQQVAVIVAHPFVAASLFTGAGARLTSVGPLGGSRADSSKLYDPAPDAADAPEPGAAGAMLIGGAALVMAGTRRQRAR